MPDFVGRRYATAERQARRLELIIVKVEKPSNEKPGTVLTQDPAAGTTVERNTGLDLVVAIPLPQRDEEPVEQKPQKKRKPGEAPSKFTGVDADNYETAYDICKAFSLKEVAREFNTPQNPLAAAEGYASQFQTAFQEAPFEGCFDGLTD
jgi:hypothetical protein